MIYKFQTQTTNGIQVIQATVPELTAALGGDAHVCADRLLGYGVSRDGG